MDIWYKNSSHKSIENLSLQISNGAFGDIRAASSPEYATILRIGSDSGFRGGFTHLSTKSEIPLVTVADFCLYFWDLFSNIFTREFFASILAM